MIWTRLFSFRTARRPFEQPAAPLAGAAVRQGPMIRRASELPEGEGPEALPRFRSSASDIGRATRGERNPNQARLKLQQAFTPSQPVQDAKRFAGRKETLAAVIRAVEEQHLHTVIFGDRGMGKTSLLHVFSRLAREARYIVRYTSCSETSEFDPVFRACAADIPLLYHSDFDPTSEAAERGGTLADLLPEPPVTPVQLGEIFARVSGTRVLIVLDEFDRAHSAEFKRSIAELIKSLSDQSARVQIVIAGVAANLSELLEHIPSIRRNVIGIPVTSMNEDEVRELLRIGETASGLTFEESARRTVIEAAQGSPYVAGLIAQYAASSTLDRELEEVELHDVRVAIERVMQESKVRLSPRSQFHLNLLLSMTTPAAMGPIAQEGLRTFGLVNAAAAGDGDRAALIAHAVEARVLVPDNSHGADNFRFADDSVALYLWLARCAG
ncbi:MAG: ATP-binding protein [Candidatus Sphingomonas colombiensis]|nr:ATP-binding protein [Sphingomonas sp.]WEK44104.1 MAG: ATP-binding protein [Sphingomonas sp.]